jgi:UDPglucose--hexose-1-phosphate uridylyltransferase
MVSFRTNPITGEPVVFAPERAERPRAFGDGDTGRCPFCPGHESDTPPQITALGEPWRVRIFPNKYPPLPLAEVIVEAPEHGATFDAIPHVRDVVAMYAERYRAHGRAAYTALFKNEGPRGGASIPHVHSQVIPVRFIPPRIESELAGFLRAPSCPLCGDLAGTIIGESESFVWLAPEGSKMPYQQWLVPRRHMPELSDVTEREIDDLAEMLRKASRAMLSIDRSYNWMFLNFREQPRAHWYVDLFPRVTNIAGFELGTGTFVEIVDPAAAARRLGAR